MASDEKPIVEDDGVSRRLAEYRTGKDCFHSIYVALTFAYRTLFERRHKDYKNIAETPAEASCGGLSEEEEEY